MPGRRQGTQARLQRYWEVPLENLKSQAPFKKLQGEHTVKVIFKPNSIDCFVLARNPLAIQHPCSKFVTQHIKMFSNHRMISSDNFFLHLQSLKCKNLQLFDAGLVKSRFSLCSGHRAVPKLSNFECFQQLALLGFTQNVHRDPPPGSL